MNKKIFTPKQCVIFDYQLGTATDFADLKGGIPVVVFASDSGETGIIPYEKIENPRKLNIETKHNNALRQLAETLPDTIISYTKGKKTKSLWDSLTLSNRQQTVLSIQL